MFSDLYEVIDRMTIAGKSVINVYQVMRDNVGVNAADIGVAYDNTFLTPFLPIQPSSVVHDLIEVTSLSDPLDFASIAPSPNAGTRVGEGFAQFVSLGVQFNRQRTDMKNGQKRFFCGVEPDGNNGVWEGAFLVEAGGVVDNLLNIWERGNQPGVPMCTYVIVKRICVGTPPPDPCLKYRLPIDDAELVFYTPDTALLRSRQRSQVSRKRLV